ncbi:MAG: Fic/DOC family protein [bacterium]
MNDPYVYSGSDVLINKLNIKDEKEWIQTELIFSFARIGELKQNPIKGNFDFVHLKRIHEYIFQDIYNWAGQDRNCDISKYDLYCKAIYLNDNAKEIFRQLKKENYLKGFNIEDFKLRATEYMAWIYHLHPFREGNTRSLCEFMRELTLNAGYELDFGKANYKELREALFASVHELTNDKLAIVLDKCIT